MIFMCTYQVDRDKQADTQAFFATMSAEQIAGEFPNGVNMIGRWFCCCILLLPKHNFPFQSPKT